MYDVEVWIDVVARGGGRNDTVCTLFANQSLPMRPVVGETLSFYQEKGSNLEFRLISPIGVARSASVSVIVDDVRHYAVRSNGKVMFKTAIRCSEVPVHSEEDASAVCELMTKQLGFSIDPYAVNRLASDS